MDVPTPEEMADELVRKAPDTAWLRALTDLLDRRVRTDPLERFTTLWDLTGAEAGRVFGISRQAFAKWFERGIPSERAESVAHLSAATELLGRRVKRERIPAVVRRRAEALGGLSLLEMACRGQHREVREAVEATFGRPVRSGEGGGGRTATRLSSERGEGGRGREVAAPLNVGGRGGGP